VIEKVSAGVGIQESALARVEPFPVVAGEGGGDWGWMVFGGGDAFGYGVAVFDETANFEGIDIHLVKGFLHGGVVDLVSGID